MLPDSNLLQIQEPAPLDESPPWSQRRRARPGGTLAIVTDNRRYGRTLAETLGGIGGFADLAEPSNPPAVRPGLPPPACGYEDQEASSFFDRLWANGKKMKRYHLGVSRVATSGE